MDLKDQLIGKLREEVLDVTVGATGLTPSQIYNVAETAMTFLEGAKAPSPKSVSGATDVYLTRIMDDFKNFSASDAEVDLRDFIREYLAVKYEGAEEINAKNVGSEVLASIEKSNVNYVVSDVVYNKFAIAGYQKSQDYATIRYQVSCGFNLLGDDSEKATRIETRYKINYSLRFTQSDDKAIFSYVCPNCNATIGVADVNECPYCGAKLVMDTLYSWYVASISEG